LAFQLSGFHACGRASCLQLGEIRNWPYIRLPQNGSENYPRSIHLPWVQSRSGSMTDEEIKQRIAQWQDRLHETFDYNDILGGKFLYPMMQLEQIPVEFTHNRRA
jgi:hypothetical protein